MLQHRLLPREAVDLHDEGPTEADAFVPTLLRVPHEQVRLQPPDEEGEEIFRLHGVIRAAAAQHASPFEVPALIDEPQLPLPAPPEEMPPLPPESVPYTRREIEALKAGWRTEWEAEAEDRAEAAREAGYREGAQAMHESVERDVAALRATFVEDIQALHRAWAGHVLDTQQHLAELAFTLAEQLLHSPLTEPLKAVSTRALAEALEPLANEARLEVRLHPVDLLRLQESGVMDQLSGSHLTLRWLPDDSLAVGDWVVSSPTAATRRLQDELLDALHRQLRTLATTAPPEPPPAQDPPAPDAS
ncbi:MAG: hypothetical protein AAF970_08710 [Bacteroidota bacterium]